MGLFIPIEHIDIRNTRTFHCACELLLEVLSLLGSTGKFLKYGFDKHFFLKSSPKLSLLAL